MKLPAEARNEALRPTTAQLSILSAYLINKVDGRVSDTEIQRAIDAAWKLWWACVTHIEDHLEPP